MGLQGYRAEVRRTFEATEKIFAADMKWRDEWVEGRKKERRNERRKAKQALKEEEEGSAAGQEGSAKISGGRIFPQEDEEESRSSSSPGRVAPKTEGNCCSGPAVQAEGSTGSGRRVLAEEETEKVEGQSFSIGLSGAERHHNPQDDEAVRGAEEGLLTRPLGKGAPHDDPLEDLRGQSAGTASPGSTRRRSTRSNGRRRGSRGSTSGDLKPFAGEEGVGGVEGSSGEDRTRGPCQGSDLSDFSKQGLEKQVIASQDELLGGDSSPSSSDVREAEEGIASLVPVPGQETEGVADGEGTPGRAEGHPGRVV